MTDKQREFQNRVLVNAQHLLHLINEILDLSKIEAGRLELIDKPFNLRQLIDEVVRQNQVLADKKGLTFVSEVDERLPEMLVGDVGRIKQVVINLVSNAIKFTDEGTVSLRAALHEDDKWQISVSDTGLGISPTMQEVIFDEFRQSKQGIERGGTGLGLAIVRQLVSMMGGTIRLTSDVGKGSTFVVTLPIITQESSEERETLEVVQES